MLNISKCKYLCLSNRDFNNICFKYVLGSFYIKFKIDVYLECVDFIFTYIVM